MRRFLMPVLAAGALVLTAAVPAFAHAATGIVGTVDCQGNYTIQVSADVWGGVHLIVTLDGAVISDTTPNAGANSAPVQLYTFTGTGASAGQVATAKTGDQESAVSTTLTAGDCPTASPSPSPSPSPKPSATPGRTTSVTPPATDTQTPQDPAGSVWLILLSAVIVGGVVVVSLVRDVRR